MTNSILYDKTLQEHLDKSGYAVFDFLGKNEIESILKNKLITSPEFYNSNYKYQVSIHKSNKVDRKTISDELSDILSDSIEKNIKNYKLYGVSYGNKKSSSNTFVSLHHEWSLVDEEQYKAYTIWVPLVDIHFKNGPVYILPGSQYGNVVKYIRPINSPYFFDGHQKFIENCCFPIYLKAGQALIFNQSLVHFSTPNFSDCDRPCVMISLKDEGAVDNYIYFHKKLQSKVYKYKVPDDFAFDIDDFANIPEPQTNAIEQLSFSNPVVLKKEIKEIVYKMLFSSGVVDSRFDFFVWRIKSVFRKVTLFLLSVRSYIKR